ncbi:tRNA cyclic N6-threonylcarbamoyladenosine(37) synthase TcdA [Candidatus Vallotia cooleyia]|uniref:tRNA cyclic N6-threonylcarbamoyladenosine(37) synthase TcdA n=1 Tax=Candidatus Vallotiella adelgis TaxID=1177211 RepID=UPI001D00BCC3|nr:tRNA cyclic N6-threonylcarbamoyladenosine(37) synthase TcdA [Candidatus Vallotia cooleyia]UDG82010.1 tRNA threonylcarbamoyladenosine dehydratase [Candidatus Vallotia cooleyia]
MLFTARYSRFERANYLRRFGGVARLYGEETVHAFKRCHVAVIGIGGVGSWVAEALARSAVGYLTLIDLDNISESNTNRQIHALNGNYGKPKVAAMAERIAEIHPQCVVTQVEDFVGFDNLDTRLGDRYNYIVDAIDSVRTKAALIAWCVQKRIPLVTVGGAGGQLDPTRIRINDLAHTIQDPLLSKVRVQLRKHYGFPRATKAKFNVPAVYSDEQLIYPKANAGGWHRTAAFGRLNCAGFGSSVCVTGGFGFVAAAHVLHALASCKPVCAPGFSE